MVPTRRSISAAFLFTEIEDATLLWDRDPTTMGVAVARHDALLNDIMAAHGGHVFKILGGAFCVAFGRSEMAVAAALDAQRALSAENFGEVDSIRVRMAIHAGEVELRDGDYFGQPVNRVARLLSIAHGGQVAVSGVVTDTVQGLMPPQAKLRDLGQHRLRDLTNPEQVYQLLAPGLRSEFPPLRSLNAMPNNLPQQVTSFIGRDMELQEIRDLLAKNRLVSLVGSGGLGKTRMSLQVGAELLSQFQDGVWLLELAPLTDGPLVAETAAAMFGLSVQSSGATIDMVATYLRDKRLLLILDNCEHVVSDAAKLATAILRSCPGVTILASSREGLAVAGEFAYRMPSLSVPERPELVTAEQAMTYGAVRLFVERGQDALGSFVLTDENAPIVAEICRRLDGIALAIELAAPRLRMLDPAGLLARLKDRFRLLTGGDRSALPRQQTLRALIDWSYVLLSPTEQVLLQRLSVFGGSWTIEAAAEVASGGPIEEWEIFDLVASLVDKSLVMPIAGTAGESRYHLLESTRDYALEKLVAGGDAGRKRLLAEHICRMFEQADAAWQTTPTETWLAQYQPEQDNVRSALEWAFGPEGDPALGARLVSRTVQFLGELSLLPELWRWSQAALAAKDPSMPADVEASILLSSVFHGHFGNRQNEAAARKAVSLFRTVGDPMRLARALRMLSGAVAWPNQVAEAEACLREAEALLRPRPRTKEFANLLSNLAVVRWFSGDQPAAMALSEESLTIARRLGHRTRIEIQGMNLAEFEFDQGNVAMAISRAREVEAACRRSGNLVIMASVLANLAGYLLASGEVSMARAAALEGLRLARALGLELPAVVAIEHLALIAAWNGNHTAAAAILGYGGAWYRREQKIRGLTEEATVGRLIALLEAALPPEDRARHEAAGAAWSAEKATEVVIGAAVDEAAS